ncbi:MAG: tRNA uridine-5-carboxymethylaminomethyl(34) synthesis GTPase MnmE [Bacteroidales bacterium]|nr:tRNA uridine-5-carboxymethylaminomethyl(34) synthesis GTPase MnmE [Bacteroidales bacterium]
MQFDDTICAPASPPGGAISLIRLTGKESYFILNSVIQFPSEKKSLKDLPANTIHFSRIVEGKEVIDEVMISLFKAPHSYTGEDMIEISCHGSAYIQNKILELLITNGARLARPGEFTQRAFLAGKMDLSQAEAVADLIASESAASHRVAINQMRGGFSEELKRMRAQLLQLVSMIELELDFGEEEVEFANRDELKGLVTKLLKYVNDLLDSFQLGNVLKNGIPVAIIGKPNVGKSTLLNRLLKEEKAIVSDIEGTTRDSIEDTIIIDGVRFRFIDTAGIRETADFIENLGIRRTYQKIDQAEIVLLLSEATDSIENMKKSYVELSNQIEGKNKKLLLIINKSDKLSQKEESELKNSLQGLDFLFLSALNDPEMNSLSKLLLKTAEVEKLKETNLVITNVRHFEALSHSSNSLNRVIEGIDSGLSEDLLSQDIRECLYHIGEITGEVTTDEILGNIFRNFCIGK